MDVDPDLPELNPEMIEDDELLALAVDALVLHDVAGQLLVDEIVFQEGIIKQIVDAGVWTLFLRVDELRGDRNSELLLAVARWAFKAGKLSSGRQP